MLRSVKLEGDTAIINAEYLDHKSMNRILKSMDSEGIRRVKIKNVYGIRYIGAGMKSNMDIEIYGTPGNDLGIFMDGLRITVHGNVQDGCGNTMNSGEIIVHGHGGDIVGYSMRGGAIYVRGDVGYRAGIHMKGYGDRNPVLVIGGEARDFLGEYMAGGIILILGLNMKKRMFNMRFVGSGMHGGVIYLRGRIDRLGEGVEAAEVNEEDMKIIGRLAEKFCRYFNYEMDEVMDQEFMKVIPLSHRPYGGLYTR